MRTDAPTVARVDYGDISGLAGHGDRQLVDDADAQVPASRSDIISDYLLPDTGRKNFWKCPVRNPISEPEPLFLGRTEMDSCKIWPTTSSAACENRL